MEKYTEDDPKTTEKDEASGKELNPKPEKDTNYFVVVDKNGKVKKNSSSKGLAIEDLTFAVSDYIATIK